MKHDNLREPWYAPLFHDAIYIPPLAPGYVANAFLDKIEELHRGLIAQSKKLATAGQWIATALKEKKKVSVVAVGHSYPEILELDRIKNYPLSWLPSISDLRFAHPTDLGKGDVILHLGYSPVQIDDVNQILKRGTKFIYSSPFGRPATLKDHPHLLWLDLPWRPGDATVDIPGYSVRLLPGSSTAPHDDVFFNPVRSRENIGMELGVGISPCSRRACSACDQSRYALRLLSATTPQC